jgi:uncharacterized protein (TIGR03067 family)
MVESVVPRSKTICVYLCSSVVPTLCPLVVLLWLLAPAAAQDAALGAELARQQGVWRTSTSIYNGQEASAETVRSITRTVEKDHVVWKRDGKSFAGTRIVLDPSRDPKAIDVIPDGGPNRDERVLGIYKLEGDRLTICMAAPGKPRPSEFKAEKGNGCTLRTFVREK